MGYENYSGSTSVISGLIQENNRDFPIARAKDIAMSDGTRLEDYLANMGGGSGLPDYTEADNGKFLRLVDGSPAWVAIPNAEEAEF